jgi:hypothetical protein
MPTMLVVIRALDALCTRIERVGDVGIAFEHERS